MDFTLLCKKENLIFQLKRVIEDQNVKIKKNQPLYYLK